MSSPPGPHRPPTSIDPATTLGAVRLTVADLEAMRRFYEEVLGLSLLERGVDTALLGVDRGAPLVELLGQPEAPPAPRPSTGLFHLALLVPGRAELARTVERIAGAGWRFTGASDHFVSEAFYLDDPEGNGIEVYRDRPREDWRWSDGQVEMGTVPLDVEGVMAAPPAGAGGETMAPGTVLGHVHLRVADLTAAERFYHGLLGFDVTVRSYPGALFASAGGYHHHVGMNTWGSRGATAPAEGSRGLLHFEVIVPTAGDLAAIAERLDAAGVQRAEKGEGSLIVSDPSGNGVLLRVAGG